MFPTDHSSHILVKKVSEFCLCSLPEANVMSFGLIPLAEGISKQASIDFVVWILVVILIKIYNEEEEAKQSKLQKENFEQKKKHQEVEWS